MAMKVDERAGGFLGEGLLFGGDHGVKSAPGNDQKVWEEDKVNRAWLAVPSGNRPKVHGQSQLDHLKPLPAFKGQMEFIPIFGSRSGSKGMG